MEEREHSEQHRCCNSISRKRNAPVTNIFTWLEGYASFLPIAYPAKVPESMAYQTTILCCYRDFEYAYHCQAALSNDLNSSKINMTLYSLCFAGRAKKGHVCAHRLSNNHTTDGCPEAPLSIMQPSSSTTHKA